MFSDLPPGCDNLPTSELLFSVFCVPSSPGPRAAEHCRCVHGTCCCTAAGAALYSYHRCDCWSIRRVSGTEKRSVNGSYRSTFFIVIVASLPHVWSDYPMALMIERQDWGLRVINDFESCHHLPNLCRVTWPGSTSTASTLARRMSCVGLILTFQKYSSDGNSFTVQTMLFNSRILPNKIKVKSKSSKYTIKYQI